MVLALSKLIYALYKISLTEGPFYGWQVGVSNTRCDKGATSDNTFGSSDERQYTSPVLRGI